MASVSVNSPASSTTKTSGFSTLKTVSSTHLIAAAKPPSRKAFARSPYRERTVMLRVPESLAKEFRQRLEQHKQAVAAGDHDNWN